MKPRSIRESFRTFPAVLQHQILLRCGLTLGRLAAFGLFWALSSAFWFGAPFLMLAFWTGVSAVQTFLTVFHGKYACVHAICKQVVTTAILKRPKVLILSTEQGDIRIRIQQRIRKPEINEQFILYLADSTQLYQSEDGYLAQSYLGLSRQIPEEKMIDEQ